MNHYTLPILIFLLFGTLNSQQNVEVFEPSDLQIMGVEADRVMITPDYQKQLREKFKSKYYRVWSISKYNGEDTRSYLNGLYRRYSTNNQYFAQNKREWTEKEREKYINSANLGDFPTLAQKAITIHATNARLLPTNKPMFLDYALAGEGYPFDYLQNSAIWPSTPLLIVHQSQDKAWFYCIAPYVEGWIMAKDIATVDDKFISSWTSKDYSILLEDEYPLINQHGFITSGYIGTVLPLANSTPLDKTLLVANRDEEGSARIEYVKVGVDAAADNTFKATKANFLALIEKLYGSPYGWGGAYFTRDCSALLRDIYSPFGIWLPRNSGSQINAGDRTIEIGNMSKRQKRVTIRDSAHPYFSLLYKKGHIVMYIGTHNNQMLIFQSVWGVKTDNLTAMGRYIIGATTITDLEPGKNLPHVNATLLDGFSRFNILLPEEAFTQ